MTNTNIKTLEVSLKFDGITILNDSISSEGKRCCFLQSRKGTTPCKGSVKIIYKQHKAALICNKHYTQFYITEKESWTKDWKLYE